MTLHENNTLYKQAIAATAQWMEIPDVYIEKDYWVTTALHTLFHSDIAHRLVFKGGTALSKCTGLIERFSEDIDLALLQTGEETGNQLRKRLKQVATTVEQIMPEVHVEDITHKMGMNRKTAHKYPIAFEGDFGQVRDKVIVEATVLGHFEPHFTTDIKTYVHDMMAARGQEDIIATHKLQPFEVRVLSIERTICEKIMSLIRFSHTDEPVETLKQKIRHTYDLQKLLSHPEYEAFFQSHEFDEMLDTVAQNDVESYRSNNAWLANHPKDAMLFSELETIWPKLEDTYTKDFGRLVYGDLPSPESVFQILSKIASRLQKINLKINNDDLKS